MRQCKTCNITKPLTDFYTSKHGRDGIKTECKKCNISTALLQRKIAVQNGCCPVHPKRAVVAAPQGILCQECIDKRRDRRIRRSRNGICNCCGSAKHPGPGDCSLCSLKARLRKYKISLKEYYDLKNSQKGICPICIQPLIAGTDEAVDHDHKTNKIRGLLHNNCNCLLGFAKDQVFLLENAITYLKGKGN